MSTPTPEQVAQAPKVLLHDHLDGGLRPQTVIDLAEEASYGGLPSTDPAELGRWFTSGADRKSLELYLEGFSHTVAVMQTADALARVAAEAAEDLAADGVVYAEVRFAPELHTQGGLTMDEVVEAVLDGFDRGMESARRAGQGITVGTLITAMRHAAHSQEVAQLAMRHRSGAGRTGGVVGFDIAGAESGHPPTRHLAAFQLIQRELSHITIHAGEAFGLPSIWEALQFCNAERLGHGVRIIDDIEVADDGRGGDASLGRLAAFVRDNRVPLEMCPTSNVHTGAAPSLAEHPIDLLKRLRFRVTLNTDNRLMSGVSMTSEMQAMVDTHAWTLEDLRWVTINAMKSAFWPFDERIRLIDEVIKPGYAALGATGSGPTVEV